LADLSQNGDLATLKRPLVAKRSSKKDKGDNRPAVLLGAMVRGEPTILRLVPGGRHADIWAEKKIYTH